MGKFQYLQYAKEFVCLDAWYDRDSQLPQGGVLITNCTAYRVFSLEGICVEDIIE